MAKLPKNLYGYVIPVLRKLWLRWPGRTIARDKAKVFIKEGNFQNGKPKFTRYWVCQNPECGLICREKEFQINHKEAVIEPEVGFVDFDVYIKRLLVPPEKLELLCISCHAEVTKKENARRK